MARSNHIFEWITLSSLWPVPSSKGTLMTNDDIQEVEKNDATVTDDETVATETPDLNSEETPTEQDDTPKKEEPKNRKSKIKENGLLTVRTIRALQSFLGCKQTGVLDADTFVAMGEWLQLGSPFSMKLRRHVRAFQREVGLSGPQITGLWYKAIKKNYDVTTTESLQRYLNEQS